jgi:HSP20 family molecular chaperone IbpA
MLGFDELEQMLARMNKSAEGFPPYNIEQLDDTYLRITLAVAGYLEDNLDITLEDNQLVIRGHQENNPNRRYLHRGIAARTFLKSFVLAL